MNKKNRIKKTYQWLETCCVLSCRCHCHFDVLSGTIKSIIITKNKIKTYQRCCFYWCHCHFDVLSELGDGWCGWCGWCVVFTVVVVLEVIKVIVIAKTKNKHSIKNFRKKTSRGGLPLITLSHCCCWCGRCCGHHVVVVVVVVVRWAGSSESKRPRNHTNHMICWGWAWTTWNKKNW